MLRARALQERGNSYVCAFCRHKLSPREEQLRGRQFPSISNSIIPSAASRSPKCLVSQISAVRPLSSSATLFGPNDSSGSSKPGAFPGGFGVKLGTFGSFGSQGNAPQSDSQPSSLLRHELEARQQSGVVPKKPPTENAARTSPKGAGSSPKKQKSKKGKGKGNKQKNDQEPEDKLKQQGQPQRIQLSSDLLAEAFRTDRAPRPVATPRSWGSDQPKASSQSEQGLGQPKWGAFSARKAETEIPTSQPVSRVRATSIEPLQAPPAASNKGDIVWGQLKRASRAQGRSQQESASGTNFWDSLEDRVKRKRTPEPIPEASIQPLEFDHPKDAEETQPKRKSRFEEEEEEVASYGKGKKDKRRQQKRRQNWDEQEDWDDETVSKWEARQRRKAEKEARKLAGEATEAAPVPIFLPEYISVANLAQALRVRQTDFLNDLEQMGFEDLTSDTIMTGDTAALVAMEYGYEPTVDTGSKRDLQSQGQVEDMSSLPPRPPVVTIMGHVDHGKTTLLDWLRKSSVAAQEHGGITQHIGAFVVQMSSGKQITFLDTPGHAAFLSMRQRGANVTDIVVLVVAADDSVMPQTIEALKHARAAKVPIIVAINKIDKEDARIDQVKADLSRNGVEIEDFGGDVQVVCVSGKTGQGMEDLEENIVTLSEILDVRAQTDGMAEGWILESSVKQVGRSASVLVKRGTLRLGDVIVAGKTWARIRDLKNEAGVSIPEAPPGTPVEILGWRDLPEAGEEVLQAADEGKARTAVEYRQEMSDREQSSIQLAEQEQRQREKAAAEEAAAEAAKAAEAQGGDKHAAPAAPEEIGISYQNFVVKADVAGSVEAVCGTIQEIGNNEVQSRILRSSAGPVTEYDVDHAQASNSIIVNFNNTILPHIRNRAGEANVRIIDHSIIYQVASDVKDALAELLPKIITHRVLGEADVLQIFSINIKKRVFKNIAGCKVRNGAIRRTSMVKVIRGGEVIHQGKIDTLKHVKKDVMEMGKGTECGIALEGFDDLQVDDQVQTYEIIEEKRTL